MSFKIRNLEYGDYDKNHIELLSQLTSIDKNKISLDDYKNFVNKLNKNHQIIVIEKDNNIVATGTILIEHKLIHNINKVAHIEDVVVDENNRSHGLGKAIVNTLISIANDNKCYKIILDCETKNIPFYEKCGFKQKSQHMVIYT